MSGVASGVPKRVFKVPVPPFAVGLDLVLGLGKCLFPSIFVLFRLCGVGWGTVPSVSSSVSPVGPFSFILWSQVPGGLALPPCGCFCFPCVPTECYAEIAFPAAPSEPNTYDILGLDVLLPLL